MNDKHGDISLLFLCLNERASETVKELITEISQITVNRLTKNRKGEKSNAVWNLRIRLCQLQFLMDRLSEGLISLRLNSNQHSLFSGVPEDYQIMISRFSAKMI